MRTPARQHRRSKNRQSRRELRSMMEGVWEQYARERAWIEYERIGMLVHRPQDLAVVTSI